MPRFPLPSDRRLLAAIAAYTAPGPYDALSILQLASATAEESGEGFPAIPEYFLPGGGRRYWRYVLRVESRLSRMAAGGRLRQAVLGPCKGAGASFWGSRVDRLGFLPA